LVPICALSNRDDGRRDAPVWASDGSHLAVLDALFSTGWLPLLGCLFAALTPTVPPALRI